MVAVTSQLERWRGEFGRAYTDRNVVDWRTRVESFRDIVRTDSRSILEIGSNRGHNILALREACLPWDVAVVGVEPSAYARKVAWKENKVILLDGSIYDLGRFKHRFDLVFTSGVLIHVPPDRLDDALRNVYLSSRKYILAIEYFASEDTTVPYRGHADMLWKRDYGAHYQRLFPDLTLVETGDDIPGFDGATFWLLAK